MIRSFKRALPRFLLKNQTPSSSLLQGQKSNVRALSTTDTNRPSGRKPKIVVVGSGWGGYLFTLGIDKKKYDVQMISPSNHFLFTPLLPSSAVGTLEFRAIQEPVRKISGLSEFYHAKALSVDFNQRVVECQSIFEHDKESFQVPYDYLVVSSGCKTNTFNTPGIAENEGEQVWFLKHLYHARQIRNRIVECFERAAIHNTEEKERDRLLTFAIVGGGPTSVEFVGELHDLVLRDMKTYYPDLQKHVSVHLIEAGPRLLPSFHPDLGDLVKRRFEKRGIGVKTNTAVKSMVVNEENAREKYIVLESDGKEIHLPVGLLVWSAGLEQVNFVKSAFNDFKKGPGGRIVVSDCLLAQMLETGACNDPPSQERVFAIGDCAVNLDTPLAPLAIVAKQQANYISKAFNSIPEDAVQGLVTDSKLLMQTLQQKPFGFVPLFSMVTFGSFQGAIDFSALAPSAVKDSKNLYLHGILSFLTWRSAYWGMQTSVSNKLLIPMYWFKSFVFGRDISRF